MAKFVSKLLLFVFNVVYFMAAVAILVIGSMTLAGSTVILDMLDLIEDTTLIQNILDWKSLMLGAAIYLTTLGSLAVLLSFLGCFGALKGHKIILIFFAVSKACIILFNLALIMYNAIVPFHGQEHVTSLMHDNLVENYIPIDIDNNGVITLPPQNTSAYYWAKMEFEEACCGAENYTDYSDVNLNLSVSATCCMQIKQYKIPDDADEFVNYDGCIAQPMDYKNYRGCSDYVMTQILGYRQIYILTAATFVALEVILIILTVRVNDKRSSIGTV